MKLYINLYCREWVFEVPRLFQETYDRCQRNIRLKRILDAHVEYSWRIFRFTKFLLYFVVSFLAVSPLVLRVFTGIRVLPIGILIPFVNVTESPGYELNYVNNLFSCILAMRGFTCSNSYFLTLLVTARAQVKVLAEMLQQLEDFEAPEQTKRKDSLEINKKLQRIVQEQQFHLQ